MTRIRYLVCATACGVMLCAAGCANSAVPGTRNIIGPSGAQIKISNRSVFAIPNHVLTLADVKYTDHISPTQAAPYLDWASVTVPDANNFSKAGIKTMFYTDPNRVSPGQKLYTTDESTFAHDCGGHRITINGRPGPKYQMNPASGDLAALWKAWVDKITRSAHFDAIFDDSADSVYNTSALPCGFDQLSWTEASNLMNVSLGHSIIYNGLGTLADGFTKPPPSIKLNASTYGGTLEGCYANPTAQNPLPKLAVWDNYETTELTMSQMQKPFDCRGFNTFPARTSLAWRIYMYASFLLTYDLSSSMISEKFSTPSNLEVFPEAGFVAMSPLISQPADVAALQTSTWTFGRQYAACYLWGQAIGACAAVVNADSPNNSHPFPWPGVYSRTLVLRGAGVLDGGKANVNGPAPSAVVAGTSAVIAIQ
jgi:hypothetical protein